MSKPFSDQFLKETVSIANNIDYGPIERAVQRLAHIREMGRLFILGVGGSAANASHAVNDFRKIASIEAYAPTDNVSEITARTNDEGWATVFEEWLKGSNLTGHDAVLVLSVGGGDLEKNVSPNLVKALQYARSVGATIIGIVGRNGGFTATVADECIIIPTPNPEHTTPHSEAWQSVVWHLMVSHPALKRNETKWESTKTETKLSRAVFFDRDGTLTTNPKPEYPLTIPNVDKPLQRLRDAGFKLIMVTNQPDIARGKKSLSFENGANDCIREGLGLDAVYMCPHDGGCECRKPKPGMLLQAAREHNIDLSKSYMVGDSWRDTVASRRAGTKTIWFRNTATPPGIHCLGGFDYVVTNLSEAADWILEDMCK